MINFGSVPLGSVLPVVFASYAAATGASATLTGLAVTDIEIYKGTSTTQRASDAGYTLLDTDGIDIDGLTGIHGFSIDTGDNTDSGFYTAGSFYTVVVSAVTIDSQTVNFIAATFRLAAAENTAGYPVATVKAGTGTGELDLSAGAIKLRTILKQNVGFRLPFTMKDSTGAPLTGSTVTVTRSVNGAAFGATTAGTATELANGWYYIDLSNGDVNGTNIAIRMTGSGGSGTPVDNAMTLLMEP